MHYIIRTLFSLPIFSHSLLLFTCNFPPGKVAGKGLGNKMVNLANYKDSHVRENAQLGPNQLSIDVVSLKSKGCDQTGQLWTFVPYIAQHCHICK